MYSVAIPKPETHLFFLDVFWFQATEVVAMPAAGPLVTAATMSSGHRSWSSPLLSVDVKNANAAF